jgi:bacillithiol system protein YtxJ
MRELLFDLNFNESMPRLSLANLVASKVKVPSGIRKANIVEVRTPEECLALFGQNFAVIFKHSEACAVSKYAYGIVSQFCSEQASFKVHLLSVLRARSASGFVEEQTGVCHKSPQVLALRNGKVFAHASHEAITRSFLAMLHVAWEISGR